MTHAVVDSLIVGGGPAGLTAATYLGRFRRSVVIVDDGDSRLKRIPLSRNIPGFPEGVSGRDMHARLMQQAGRYGARLLSGRVAAIAHEDGLFCAETPAGLLRAKTVLLATGVAVADPEIDGLDDAVRLGLIRYCPICDGFEAGGRRIAVLGARRIQSKKRCSCAPTQATWLLSPWMPAWVHRRTRLQERKPLASNWKIESASRLPGCQTQFSFASRMARPGRSMSSIRVLEQSRAANLLATSEHKSPRRASF
jgi:thioredoxin reductase